MFERLAGAIRRTAARHAREQLDQRLDRPLEPYDLLLLELADFGPFADAEIRSSGLDAFLWRR